MVDEHNARVRRGRKPMQQELLAAPSRFEERTMSTVELRQLSELVARGKARFAWWVPPWANRTKKWRVCIEWLDGQAPGGDERT